MRTVAAVLVVVGWWCSSGIACAADLSGVWMVDRAAWERQLDRLVGAMMARLPPEIAAQMRSQGTDPTAAIKASAIDGLDSSIRFLPGGVVRTASVADGDTDDGRWTLSGEDLRIEVDDVDGLEAMVGTIDGDRISLRPIVADDDPQHALLREMIYPLVRRR